MAKPPRRQAGEGGISEYAIKADPSFLIKYSAQPEDGARRIVLERGFKTRKETAAALRADLPSPSSGIGSSRRSSASTPTWPTGSKGSG
jgi:hypothetical protein